MVVWKLLSLFIQEIVSRDSVYRLRNLFGFFSFIIIIIIQKRISTLIKHYRRRRSKVEANSCRVEPVAVVTGCRTGATSTDAMTSYRTAAEEQTADVRSWYWAVSDVAFYGGKRYTKSWAESEHRRPVSTWATLAKILLLPPSQHLKMSYFFVFILNNVNFEYHPIQKLKMNFFFKRLNEIII